MAGVWKARRRLIISIGETKASFFADQARAATASSDRGRAESEILLERGGDSEGLGLMTRLAESLRAFEEVDERLLDPAARNSNQPGVQPRHRPGLELLEEVAVRPSGLEAARAGSFWGRTCRS